MPSKHTLRQFQVGGYYHMYNRGVEKRLLFLDKQDYAIFLYYLYVYLLPPDEVLRRWPNIPSNLIQSNLASRVDLIAYCLMPNHFHLLAKQTDREGITKLMKRLTNAYTRYFNNKYQRVGGLMQGVYKAIEIESQESLLQVSRYIHLNPLKSGLCTSASDYDWSSLSQYIQPMQRIDLCKTDSILSSFTTRGAYENFVKEVQRSEDKIGIQLKCLTFEDSLLG